MATTVLILAWCLVFSCLWAGLSYLALARRGARLQALPRLGEKPQSFFLMPSLVLSLLAIVVAFRLGRIRLIFPLSFELSPAELLLITIPPAFILFCASGMALHLSTSIRQEYVFWSRQPFAVMSRGLGCSPYKALSKLVLLRSLAQSYSQSLPWLFGELLVVEAIFNAPGLGQDAWHMARSQDGLGLAKDLVLLALLYGAALLASQGLHRWLGRRLASYA